MNEIYPMWIAAHGIMIITPVNWYQVSSPLKLTMDRLVCADGGNPDPTRTQGKNAELAKRIELEGWDYPRHLEGRLFAVVVHGDVEGAENVRRSIFRLALFHGPLSRWAGRRTRPLYRILETLRHEPRRSRCGCRPSRGSAHPARCSTGYGPSPKANW